MFAKPFPKTRPIAIHLARTPNMRLPRTFVMDTPNFQSNLTDETAPRTGRVNVHRKVPSIYGPVSDAAKLRSTAPDN